MGMSGRSCGQGREIGGTATEHTEGSERVPRMSPETTDEEGRGTGANADVDAR